MMVPWPLESRQMPDEQTCIVQTMEEAIRNDTAAQRTLLKTLGRRPRFDSETKKQQSYTHRPTCSQFCTGMFFKNNEY